VRLVPVSQAFIAEGLLDKWTELWLRSNGTEPIDLNNLRPVLQRMSKLEAVSFGDNIDGSVSGCGS
jgi:hypothetical protein